MLFIADCLFLISSCCCHSVTQPCPLFWDPMDCSMPEFSVLHYLLEFAQTHVYCISDAIQPFHPCPLLLPSIFHSIRVFSNESALLIRWPKYCSFSFSISPFNEHLGLISFRTDWFDLLAVPGTLRSLIQDRNSKTSVLGAQPSLLFNFHIHTLLLEKP